MENTINTSEEPLLFFNYHEFVISDGHQVFDNGNGYKSIVATHFPNNYVSLQSSSYETTRIVRIPRQYNTLSMSDIIPQFSLYTPGNEPAALTHVDQKHSKYKAIGTFDNNNFGETSETPLVPDLMTEQELYEIVQTVNSYLYQAFNPMNLWTLMENVLDILTATLYTTLMSVLNIETHSKRVLKRLEEYVDCVNETLKAMDVKIVSPHRSGYMSLDIQISKPERDTLDTL